jgi:hypothetical protein
MAKTCEICGEEYEAKEYKSALLFRDMKYTTQMVIHRNLEGGGELPPVKFEICHKCAASLNRWRAQRKAYMKKRREKA